ncbi:aromatic-ring-hydroxylating dioxygenase subunit beta [Bradyrhizobium canariense]|uniref:aromatic-ring-hydroxylating dioxygenase subunit beta n=1 Tax=Bradyrhizobium canariense TaxID=255045 RepID=UPI001B89F9F5|nr:aromatic-ring-hydroxylating dioxygenase subunit beta [Bradyrhizobium canariense]MBR0954930.1 aromatic-ring-hydroxylating dioxygenase subunit beta [Bradyrhizobium canariense]
MHNILEKPAKSMDAPAHDLAAELVAAYAHALDDMQMDAWPEFFTADALYHVTTRENHEAGLPIGIVRCLGRGMMTDRVKAFHSANIFEPHVYNHVIGRPAFSDTQSPGVLSVRSNFQIVRTMESGRMDLFAVGKYLDEVVLDEGRARFQKRVVVLDSRYVDILIVIPL